MSIHWNEANINNDKKKDAFTVGWVDDVDSCVLTQSISSDLKKNSAYEYALQLHETIIIKNNKWNDFRTERFQKIEKMMQKFDVYS